MVGERQNVAGIEYVTLRDKGVCVAKTGERMFCISRRRPSWKTPCIGSPISGSPNLTRTSGGYWNQLDNKTITWHSRNPLCLNSWPKLHQAWRHTA